MRRIAVVLALSLVAPLGVEAQPVEKSYRIGYLADYSPTTFPARYEGFLEGLRKLGYVEGKNIVIEYRYAHGQLELLSERVRAEVLRAARASDVR